MTQEKAEYIKQIRLKLIHFAFDRFQDWCKVVPKLTVFMETTGFNRSKVSCYVLTNFDTTLEQDLARVMALRRLNIQPYVMRYDKEHIERGSLANALARWCNMPALFWKYPTFEAYLAENRKAKHDESQLSLFAS